MAIVTKNTFKGYECKVEIAIAADGSGALPTSWGTDTNILAVGKSVSCSGSADVEEIHGLNQQAPYTTKQGHLSWEWSVDSLYTTDVYQTEEETPTSEFDILQLLDSGMKFAMKITLLDGAGDKDTSTEAASIELSGCTPEEDSFEVSDDGDATVSLSGKATGRVINNSASTA